MAEKSTESEGIMEQTFWYQVRDSDGKKAGRVRATDETAALALAQLHFQTWAETVEKMQPTNVDQLAGMLRPIKAQKALARILITLGSAQDWGGDQLSSIDEAVALAWKGTELPGYGDQDDDAIEFWQSLL